jgi:oxygen-dependent protoporphyrinogen oxidase
MSHDVVIVGGGISGLTLAWHLQQDSTLDFRVLEAGPRVGGTIGGIRDSGFFMEMGPNGFLDRVPFTMDLVRQLGISDQLQQSSSLAKKRFLMHQGRLATLPEDPKSFLLTKTISLGGKFRVAMERFKSRQKEGVEETVADFVRRRLGDQILDRYVDAFVGGVFAGDPEQLSVDACFPRLRQLEQEYGSLLKASRVLSKQNRAQGEEGTRAGPSGTLWSFKNGLSTLVDGLAAKLGDRVMLDAGVQSIRYNGRFWQIQTSRGTLQSKQIVLAVPSYVAVELLAPGFSEISASLAEIPYAPIAVVGLGLRREDVDHALDGFGYLCPEVEGRPILGCLFTSEIFPGTRAPEGHVLLRVMLGGARHPDAIGTRPADCFERARLEVAQTLGFRQDPLWSRVVRWERGIPQYTLGHQARLSRAESMIADQAPGLHLHGNAYRGVGINNCVEESGKLVRTLLQ